MEALAVMAEHPQVRLLVPTIITRTRANAEHFRMRINVPTEQGFKAVVRVGRAVQVVYIVTDGDMTLEEVRRLAEGAERAVRPTRAQRNVGAAESYK